MIDQLEYDNWLDEQQKRTHQRYTGTKLNRKQPRQGKQRDFRLSKSPLNTRDFYKKESIWVKKAWQKKTRMKLKQNIYEETYYNVYAKDYKTYGWVTW